MALNLTEAAKLSTDTLAKGVLETFTQVSPILDRIPLMNIDGNAYAYNEEATLPGVAFRGVNESYTESTGTFNQKSEKLVILGGDAGRRQVHPADPQQRQRPARRTDHAQGQGDQLQVPGDLLQRRHGRRHQELRRPQEAPHRQTGHRRRGKRHADPRRLQRRHPQVL